MKQLVSFCLFLPILVQAQQKRGIQFQTPFSWQDVIANAKSEYKYIFIELSNELCKDCDAMSNEVYLSENIGRLFNSEFISLKMTEDLFSKIVWKNIDLLSYKEVVLKHNKLTKYPIYLFFSPDGKLVHKGMGRVSPASFIQLARDASDPASQYYTLLRNYFSGLRDYPLLGALAIRAKELGDKDTADQIAADYKKNYLDQLPDSEICTAANLEFISNFLHLENTNGRIFKLSLHNQDLLDKETSKGFAKSIVSYLINREEIDDKLWKNGKVLSVSPNWEQISNVIKNKFGRNYADELVPQAKMSFYRTEGSWQAYADAVNEHYRNTPPKPGQGLSSDSWDLNGRAWDVFLHCNDGSVLKCALQWSSLSIELNPVNVQYFDTKANLLYKLGKVDEAIIWQKLALQDEIVNARLNGREKGGFHDDFAIKIEKMKKGIPTWDTK